jgi:8-oxo-dGTP pyrophosphatase MutT (NUDIX family)
MRTIQRDIVGAFIFSNDDHILLGKGQPGSVYPDTWVVPGGGIEPGETRLQAIIREVQEEMTLDISKAAITEITEVLTGESEKTLRDTKERVLVEMRFHDFVVRFDAPAKDIAATASDDLSKAKWLPISELPKLAITQPMKEELTNLGYLT